MAPPPAGFDDDVLVVGSGVGGGSLVYANTPHEPPDAFNADRRWAHITDRKAELRPFFAQAKRMLGAVTDPVETACDRVLREVADDMGVGQTYRRTPVGVQRLFGHPGLHVVDGSVMAANLGVNPCLTITAQAERAMAFWPNKRDADPRPALGEPSRRLAPVAPRRPVVPADAPAALRLEVTSR